MRYARSFDRHLDRRLREVLYRDGPDGQESLLDETAYTQCALFAVEVALFSIARFMGFFGLIFLLGHSNRRARRPPHVAGVLSLEDGVHASWAARGRPHGRRFPPRGGAMLRDPLASEDEVLPLLGRSAARRHASPFAAVNGTCVGRRRR